MKLDSSERWMMRIGGAYAAFGGVTVLLMLGSAVFNSPPVLRPHHAWDVANAIWLAAVSLGLTAAGIAVIVASFRHRR